MRKLNRDVSRPELSQVRKVLLPRMPAKTITPETVLRRIDTPGRTIPLMNRYTIKRVIIPKKSESTFAACGGSRFVTDQTALKSTTQRKLV